jgi:hypothetical protein
MKPFLIFLILCIVACSKNHDSSAPNQYGGKDLYNQLSPQEKTLIGTWYFAHEVFKLKNGTDSISTKSLIDYGPGVNETDTLQFYSTELVGDNMFGPLVAPDSLKAILKLMREKSLTAYLEFSESVGLGGWFIRDNILIDYPGLGVNAWTGNLEIQYFPIEKLDNDSLVFLYLDLSNNPLASYNTRKPVFYRK